MTTVKDLIEYLKTLPDDMPIVEGNTYAYYSEVVKPTTIEKIKKIIPIRKNTKWEGEKWHTPGEKINRDVLMIYDAKRSDY